MTTTPNLGITLVEQSQSQKEVTVNQAILTLDAVLGGGVIDKDLATPPVSPAEGDKYIVAGSPTGAWTGHAKHIAFFYNGGWRFINPGEGLFVWVNDEDLLYVYTGSAWSSSVSGSLASNMLGINGATADSTNRLAVRTLASLFTAIYAADGGSGDTQLILNKETASDVASFLFQRDFSGRAEFGLIGDDNFGLKTSPDGSAWLDVLKMMAATGRIAFKSIATGLTAAGANQAAATAITKTLSEFTTVASSTGGRLPTPEAGEFFLVANKGANALSVYPATGGAINSLSTNAAISLATDTRRLFFALTSTQWYSL
jgi:hypothetical protein